MLPSIRPTVSQRNRKRKLAETHWIEILEECRAAPSIQAVAEAHPEVSYDTIARRFKRYKEGEISSFSDRRGSSFRIFSDVQEAELAKRIRRKIDGERREYVDRQTVRNEAREYFLALHGDISFRKNIRSFSNGWVAGFKERSGFSSRKQSVVAPIKSLTAEEISIAVEDCRLEIELALEKYGAQFIFNMDEVSALQFDLPKKGWGIKGEKPQKKISVEKQVKDCITTIPTVALSGRQLNFAWILAAKTDRVLRSLALPPSVVTLRSSSGWTTAQTMISYFDQVISPATCGRPCALVLDCYGAHWTLEVLKAAFDRKIQLIPIPKGKTAELQPLDVSFNAQYKRERQQLLRDAITRHETRLEDRKQVVLRCAAAAATVTKSVLQAGWKPLTDSN